MKHEKDCNNCHLVALFKQLEEDKRKLIGYYSMKQKQRLEFVRGKRGTFNFIYPN